MYTRTLWVEGERLEEYLEGWTERLSDLVAQHTSVGWRLLGATTKSSETHQRGPVLVSLSPGCQSQEGLRQLRQTLPTAAGLGTWGQFVI